jgi:hypothetical protein
MRVYGSEWLGGDCEAAVSAAVGRSAAQDREPVAATQDPAAAEDDREPAVVAA